MSDAGLCFSMIMRDLSLLEIFLLVSWRECHVQCDGRC